MTLQLGFAMHLQTTLLAALKNSFILTPSDRAFITTEIGKHKYELHFVMNGRCQYITPECLGIYFQTAYYTSQHDAPSEPVHICLRVMFGAFRPEPFQWPSAMPPALPPRGSPDISTD